MFKIQMTETNKEFRSLEIEILDLFWIWILEFWI
jgi:hypothetical protein